MTQSDQQKRESEFHDQWARSTEVESIDALACFSAPTALENKYILNKLGALEGKRVLDVGCGLGESTVMFAKLGALTTASDLSPEMLKTTQALATQMGLSIRTHLGAAEELQFDDGSFDIIYAANIFHHISDRTAFVRNAHRILAPGGVFCCWDPVKYNPAINVYRRIATDVRSLDERPLGVDDVRCFKDVFPNTHIRFFWLSTLALFFKYFFIDRSNPNKERYWKKIYRETPESLWWWHPLRWIDEFLLIIPGIRWLSWNIVIMAKKTPAGKS